MKFSIFELFKCIIINRSLPRRALRGPGHKKFPIKNIYTCILKALFFYIQKSRHFFVIFFKYEKASAYDRQFHAEQGYYSKLKRDDRMASLGLNINSEVTRPIYFYFFHRIHLFLRECKIISLKTQKSKIKSQTIRTKNKLAFKLLYLNLYKEFKISHGYWKLIQRQSERINRNLLLRKSDPRMVMKKYIN